LGTEYRTQLCRLGTGAKDPASRASNEALSWPNELMKLSSPAQIQDDLGPAVSQRPLLTRQQVSKALSYPHLYTATPESRQGGSEGESSPLENARAWHSLIPKPGLQGREG
jgi:hypothetical protein